MVWASITIDDGDAVPSKYFALPPYTPFPARDDQPDGLHGIFNVTGFNVLTFKSAPGAKFTSKSQAYEIAARWNKERT